MSIENVEQATQLAVDFVRKYYLYVNPVSARKEFNRWIVDLDISYFNPRYARVKILADTSTIEDYKVTLGQLL